MAVIGKERNKLPEISVQFLKVRIEGYMSGIQEQCEVSSSRGRLVYRLTSINY